MYPDEHVGHRDKLKVCLFRIGEEDLWLPDGLYEHGVGQVHGGGDLGVGEARVPPLLPQVRVRNVILKKRVNVALIVVHRLRPVHGGVAIEVASDDVLDCKG
jgi:hypothetical protein